MPLRWLVGLCSLDQAHEGYPVYAVKTGPCHVVTGQVVSDGATDGELSAKLQEGLQVSHACRWGPLSHTHCGT